ncbi:MAG TPA: radical SAM protein [Candidatus Hydrogenedentes bacterium]|nr:radical SAM protein [Candidatus Hydrogenedentota bacterium]
MTGGVFRDLAVRLSVTEQCQLRCRYCLPQGGCMPPCSGPALDAEAIRLLLHALHDEFGIRKLRFTGGEPLLRRDIVSMIRSAADLGIPDIALTTNAQLLAGKAIALRQAGLHRVNISLDSLRPGVFAGITHGGRLEATLRGIRAAMDADLRPIKLNMVVMRGINDGEVSDILRFGLETGCHVRFLELMPIGVARTEFHERFVSSDEVRERLGDCCLWQPMIDAQDSSSRNWKVSDASGRATVCGFISPASHPFCGGCRRVRITAGGELIGCLARGRRLPLAAALSAAARGDHSLLARSIGRAFAMKQGAMFQTGADCMANVGG